MKGKLQAPSSKLQRNSKLQTSDPGAREKLKLGAWSFSGAWSLELGAFPRRAFARRAFTLIELLVTIVIIALLAALIIPVVQVVNRQKILRRATVELGQLETGIEAYKTARGFYPPDAPKNPAINQLYYELLGTKATPTTYTTLDGSASLPTSQIPLAFPMVDGFLNYSEAGANDETPAATPCLKGLKPDQIGEITVPGGTVPVRIIVGRPWSDPNTSLIQGTTLNPWRYNSSSPTNNPNSFDLWLDVSIGGKTYRISNWGSKPLVI